MYIDRPLRDYLDDLGARKPAPGGGSAAALTAALGTSLMLMVANFTAGKPEYKAVEDRIAGILIVSRKLDAELRALIDGDVDAFNNLMSGIKTADPASAEGLYRKALEVPLRICEISGECMKICRDLAECGNRNLITDAAIAAALFETAFISARFNVYVNLEHIKDMAYISKVHKAMTDLEERIPKEKEEILEICEDAIGS